MTKTKNDQMLCIGCKHSVRNKMSQKIHVDGFKWKDDKMSFDKKIQKEMIMEIAK